MKKRIWELDMMRGFFILVMIALHLVYDLVHLYRLIQWQYPAWYLFIQRWSGVAFLVISGICVTLGRHPVRRGLTVLGCGLVVSAVTVAMYLVNFAGKGIIIYFGVLHCLGTCMILWPLLKKCPVWLLALLGIGMVVAGFRVEELLVDTPWLVPLGLMPRGFASSDYYPLLPNMGFFLLGSVLGKTVYKNKQTKLPWVSERNIAVRVLCFLGRNSLLIYMLHQPVLAGICELLAMGR